MARIKGGMNAKKKHNRVLKMAKGYRGARSKQYRVAKQSVMLSLIHIYGLGVCHIFIHYFPEIFCETVVGGAAVFRDDDHHGAVHDGSGTDI